MQAKVQTIQSMKLRRRQSTADGWQYLTKIQRATGVRRGIEDFEGEHSVSPILPFPRMRTNATL